MKRLLAAVTACAMLALCCGAGLAEDVDTVETTQPDLIEESVETTLPDPVEEAAEEEAAEPEADAAEGEAAIEDETPAEDETQAEDEAPAGDEESPAETEQPTEAPTEEPAGRTSPGLTALPTVEPPELLTDPPTPEPTPEPPPEPTPEPTPTPEPMLDYPVGTTGMEITALQEALKDTGYMKGTLDGKYGLKTDNALRAWCEDNGVQDPQAMPMLDLLIAINNTRDLPATIRTSEDKVSVYIVQRLLNQWGFHDGKMDGIFGARTKSSLVVFMEFSMPDMVDWLQAREDARTEALLREAEDDDMPRMVNARLIDPEEIPVSGKLTRDWYQFIVSGYTPSGEIVGEGDSSAQTLRVQKRLKKLGYIANGVDGTFGENTVRAMKYFQRLNGLPETGSCDVETQGRLFSADAVASDVVVGKYMAHVSTKDNLVDILGWTDDGYTEQVKQFVCTTGAADTPTIKGTFHAEGPVSEWYFMGPSHIWVRYAFRIRGPYYFHSVLFRNYGDAEPTASSVRNLGNSASHGCVRLSVEDAQWIFENCTAGMTVVIE